MSASPPPPRSPHSQVVHSSHSPCAHFPTSSFHCGSSYSIQFPALIFRICLCKSARQSDSEDICFFYWVYCFPFFPDKVLNMFKLCSNMFSFFHPNKGDKNRTICLKIWIAIQISINGQKGRIVNTSAPPKTLFDFTTWDQISEPDMKPRIPGCTLTLRVNSDAILFLAVRGVTYCFCACDLDENMRNCTQHHKTGSI